MGECVYTLLESSFNDFHISTPPYYYYYCLYLLILLLKQNPNEENRTVLLNLGFRKQNPQNV
jgi:hypothetical protein